MGKEIHTKLAGVSKDNRQAIIDRYIISGEVLELERDPDNPYDPNAIAVFIWPPTEERKQVGYIKAELAAELAPLMDAGQVIEGEVVEVTGLDQETRGVNITLTVYDREESLQIHKQEKKYLRDLQKSSSYPAPHPKTVQPHSPKNFIFLLILWVFTGYLGGHRIYAGRGSWLYTLTFGYLLIGWMIDLVIILTGQFKDGHGQPIRLSQL